MRKTVIFLLTIFIAVLFVSCSGKNEDEEDIDAQIKNSLSGKKYVCTDESVWSKIIEGSGIPFSITLSKSGGATYSQPLYSSHAPMATWSVEDGVLAIRESNPVIVNYFDVVDDKLVFRAEDSGGFMFYRFKGGEEFVEE